MNGGQIIATLLQQYGCQHLFTLCGGHISPIYVESEKAGIQVVDVRNEASAIFAADALARLSGIPGVAAVTAGPGVTNSITALKNAQMAQSPLVLIGGSTATLLRGRGALQDIDQLSLVNSIVKWSARVKRKKQLVPLLQEALQRCQSGIPGPVFIEVPVDLLYDETTVREWYGQKSKTPKSIRGKVLQWYINQHVNQLFAGAGSAVKKKPPTRQTNISDSDIQFVNRQIRSSERPVLVIGSGAMLSPQHANKLAKAVQTLGVPVYLSGMARGLTGKDSPIHFRHKRRNALREADVILLAGVPCDFRLDYGNHLNRSAKIITLNRSRKEGRKNIHPIKLSRSIPDSF